MSDVMLTVCRARHKASTWIMKAVILFSIFFWQNLYCSLLLSCWIAKNFKEVRGNDYSVFISSGGRPSSGERVFRRLHYSSYTSSSSAKMNTDLLLWVIFSVEFLGTAIFCPLYVTVPSRTLNCLPLIEMLVVPSLDTSIVEVGCEEHPDRQARTAKSKKWYFG